MVSMFLYHDKKFSENNLSDCWAVCAGDERIMGRGQVYIEPACCVADHLGESHQHLSV